MLLFSFPYKSEKCMFVNCFKVRRYLPPTNWPWIYITHLTKLHFNRLPIILFNFPLAAHIKLPKTSLSWSVWSARPLDARCKYTPIVWLNFMITQYCITYNRLLYVLVETEHIPLSVPLKYQTDWPCSLNSGVLTIYMGKPKISVGKSNGSRHSVWKDSENMGCDLRWCYFSALLSLSGWSEYTL